MAERSTRRMVRFLSFSGRPRGGADGRAIVGDLERQSRMCWLTCIDVLQSVARTPANLSTFILQRLSQRSHRLLFGGAELLFKSKISEDESRQLPCHGALLISQYVYKGGRRVRPSE